MAVRSQVVRATPRPPEDLSPVWAQEAADWLRQQDPNWRIVGLIIGLILLCIGFTMLVFGGYTSIQGIRVPINFFGKPWGYTIVTNDVPPWQWWLIPLVNTFIQIFFKLVPGLRPLWRPSVIFDATTTAIFIAFGVQAGVIEVLIMKNGAFQLAPEMAHGVSIVAAALISAFGGILITVLAEKLFLGAFPIIWASVAPTR